MARALRKNSRQIKKSNNAQVIESSSSTDKKKEPLSPKQTLFSLRNIILASFFILLLVGWKLKGYIIAATVNGQPISRWELNEQLVSRFGQQTLDMMVNERLILSATRQKGVVVTDKEIDSRVKQIEEKLKGKATLTEALAAQGMTESMFRRQIEIQAAIEKLFAKETTISSQEIDDYVAKNGSLYKTATDQGAVRDEAKTLISQQKLSEAFENWFNEIKKNAKIFKFL